MDVAKYIGLFLLKNHFCYIHGLGNLELRKRPGSYDGTALQAPSYEIIVTPTGSIDDNLANFIATNEQISISKASNALRDFSTQARTDLQNGKEVEIPNLGKFVEDNGKVFFVTHPNFQFAPPPIPSLRSGKRTESERPDASHLPPQQSPQVGTRKATQQPQPVYQTPVQPEDEAGSSINWWRVILVLIILMAMLAGGYFGYRYYKGHNNQQPQSSFLYPTDKTANGVDTVQPKKDTVLPAADSVQSYDIIIDSYSSKKKADKRADAMKNYGHSDVQVVQDSTDYLVVLPVKCKPEDTTKIMDSLSRNYNPAGVSIFR
jgi:hypothetical protein